MATKLAVATWKWENGSVKGRCKREKGKRKKEKGFYHFLFPVQNK